MLSTILFNIVTPDCRQIQAQFNAVFIRPEQVVRFWPCSQSNYSVCISMLLTFNIVDNQEQCFPKNTVASCFPQSVQLIIFCSVCNESV